VCSQWGFGTVNYPNYDDVMAQLRAAGLLVDALEVGARKRCRVDDDREKRGWYHLHELRMDSGDTLLVGSYGVWRGNDPGSSKIELSKGAMMSADQRSALKARIAADRKQADAARKVEAARAAARASAVWAKLEASGDSEYLKRKCVLGHGVRYSSSGAVVLPLLDVAGQIHGLQAIYPADHPKRKRLGRDKDFWPAGVVKQGHFFLIGSPPVGAACLLCEGYATGASLYEATGLPVAIAFDAGNLIHVAQALRARWRGLRVLVCADDDYLGKCAECGHFTPTTAPGCAHCAKPHGRRNAGLVDATNAAMAVDGEWLVPAFAAQRSVTNKGPTDFNDLHVVEGLQAVRIQVETKLTALQWRGKVAPALASQTGGGGSPAQEDLHSISSVEELHDRYSLVYEAPKAVFDHQEHQLVPLDSMRNICTSRQIHRAWMESHGKRIVRLEDVGFDPTEKDPQVKCNMWAGWPTAPRAGSCAKLLELGEYLCSAEPDGGDMWIWLCKWLAFPVQHPGAKMKTAVIMHGGQGTGKNLFFEAHKGIFGRYGKQVDQDTVEDKYNDWASRCLLLVADEVVARQEMFHAKNKLKVLITSDTVRINPKHVTSYSERNHINLVFLSNETQPMVLERDDRRFAVIWTPQKHDEEFYNQVLAEINNGGVAALHDYWLNYPLGDFGPATLPPMTHAKQELIELGMESSESFYTEWLRGSLPLPLVNVRTEDLYAAYRHYCNTQGVHRSASLKNFIGAVSKRPGVRKERRRHYKGYSHSEQVQSTVVTPIGVEVEPQMMPLSEQLNKFSEKLKNWRDDTAKTNGFVRSVSNGTENA
jgi:putative DNA primase/helicase